MTFTRKSRLIGYGALTAGLAAGNRLHGGAEIQGAGSSADPGYTPAPVTTTSATPSVAGGEAQKFVDGQDIPGEWWTLFHSKPLDDLIERSLKANPDIKAAQAALLVARENVLAQRGAYFPGASAGFSADHSKTSNVVSSIHRERRSHLQPVHSPSQRLFCARCLRTESENGRVPCGAGTTGPIRSGCDAHHIEFQCRRRSDPGGIVACAD